MLAKKLLNLNKGAFIAKHKLNLTKYDNNILQFLKSLQDQNLWLNQIPINDLSDNVSEFQIETTLSKLLWINFTELSETLIRSYIKILKILFPLQIYYYNCDIGSTTTHKQFVNELKELQLNPSGLIVVFMSDPLTNSVYKERRRKFLTFLRDYCESLVNSSEGSISQEMVQTQPFIVVFSRESFEFNFMNSNQWLIAYVEENELEMFNNKPAKD